MPKEVCDLKIEAVVPHYRAWLYKVAGRMLSPTHEGLEDLVQEGYIAMWRAVQSFNADLEVPSDYWLKRSATQKMMTVVQRNHWTGQAKRTNGGHGGSQPPDRVLSFHEVNNADGSHTFEEDNYVPDPSAEHAIEEAEWAYHNGEIAQVLSELEPKERQYIIKRFWYDWNEPQLNLYFNSPYSPNIWRRVKPRLKESLSHLKTDHLM